MKSIEKIKKEIEGIKVETGKIVAQAWEKGDVKRLYVNHIWYVKGGRERRNSSYGYFDLNTMEFSTDIRFNNVPYKAAVRDEVRAACEEIRRDIND